MASQFKSGAVSPMELKRRAFERLVATPFKRQRPETKFRCHKRSTRSIRKQYHYNHRHEIPKSWDHFFETMFPTDTCTAGDNVLLGRDESCPWEVAFHFLEMERQFRFDLPRLPAPGSRPWDFSRPIETNILPQFDFDDGNYKFLVWENPNSIKNLQRKERCDAAVKYLNERHEQKYRERKARCDAAVKKMDEKYEQEQIRLLIPPFSKPGSGPHHPVEESGLARPSPEWGEDKYELFVWEGPNSTRMVERKARYKANLAALVEEYPDGWKMAPGEPEDRPGPMIYSRNPYAILNSEDDMSSLGSISESDDEDDELFEADDELSESYEADDEDTSSTVLSDSPSVFFGDSEVEDENESYQADDEDTSSIVLSDNPSLFFGDEEVEDEKSRLSRLLTSTGLDIKTVTTFIDFWETMDLARTWSVDEYARVVGKVNWYKEEDEDEGGFSQDISSSANLHISLQF